MSSATETAVACPGAGALPGTGASDGSSLPVSRIVPDGGAPASAGSVIQPRATGIQVFEDTRNGDRKDQACDPPGLEGCFPHPLTVLRLHVEQRTADSANVQLRPHR